MPDFKLQRRASLGSAVAKLRGPNRAGLPPYVAVPHLRGGNNPFIVESDPNTPQFRIKGFSSQELLSQPSRVREVG